MKCFQQHFRFLTLLILMIGLNACLERTLPLREWEATRTIEQQDLEYCVDDKLTNKPYANSNTAKGITPSTSFTICTEEQFLEIGKRPEDWNKHFVLRADLDFVAYDLKANHTFSPIGVYRTTLSSGDTDVDFDGIDETESDYVEDDHPFTGVFDGNNHTIYRFRATFVNNEIHQYKAIGMFPFLSVPGIIKNLKLYKHRVMKSDADLVEYGMGMLVGYNDGGEIDNVHIENGSMFGGDSNVGGLVGIQGGGRILNSSVQFESDVLGDDNIGGLVGRLENGLILQSSVTMNKIAGKNNVGGFAGYSHRGTIRDAKVYLSNNVEGREDNIGGLIGFSSGSAVLYSSSEILGIYGVENVGGFIGENLNGEVHYSSAKIYQNVEGSSDYVGGFVGLNTKSPITNSKSYMKNISGKNYVGGFIGESIESKIENNNVEIDNLLTVYHHGGGLIGQNTGGTIYGSNVQALYINATNDTCPHFGTTGGLVGESRDGEESEGRIVYSQANVTSTISGHGIIGGLVGKNNAEINFSQAITNLISVTKNADEIGGGSVGGLVGYNYSDGHYQSGRIEYSYVVNSNTIYGEGNVGGFVGKNGHYRDLEIEESGLNPVCFDGGPEDINGYRRAGGEIEFSYVDAETIYSGQSGDNVGGFIGQGWESRIQASYVDIEKSVYGVGYNSATGNDLPVTNIGGFAGFVEDSSIRSSYANVTNVYGAYLNVGGFVGQSVTSTFMYNFAVANVRGFSSDGSCNNDPITTAKYPTQELCEAIGECTGNLSIKDAKTCNNIGYCFDPLAESYPDFSYDFNEFNDSNIDVEKRPETCIQAGACYAFSTPYEYALNDLRGSYELYIDSESLNVENGTNIVDYRERCLASYSCIDANGEITDATTYDECIRGGMCLTTLEDTAQKDESDGPLQPFLYDDGNNGDGGEVSLKNGTIETSNYVRDFGGEIIRTKAECCTTFGGLEDGNHPHEIRWVSNKWVKNYWVPYGFNWIRNRHNDDQKQCLNWNNTYSWVANDRENVGDHFIPSIGRFAGQFDYQWSEENNRYYHQSLWIHNYTANDATNTCENSGLKPLAENILADAEVEDHPEVDAYDCKFDQDNNATIDDADNFASVLNFDQVSCHDYTARTECSDNFDNESEKSCQCDEVPEKNTYQLYRYEQKTKIFYPEDIISCDNVFDPPEGGEANDTVGDTVSDFDEDIPKLNIGTRESCNDSIIMQHLLYDQLRVSYWVDNSIKKSAGCAAEGEVSDDFTDDYYDDYSSNDFSEEVVDEVAGDEEFVDEEFVDEEFVDEEIVDEELLELTGVQKVVEGDCYDERYLFKKANPPLKYWDFNHFWDNYLDKYPTIKKVDK